MSAPLLDHEEHVDLVERPRRLRGHVLGVARADADDEHPPHAPGPYGDRVILVLGGTAEARALAAALDAEGVAVTSSLAGRVANPRLPAGAVRIGGFGGPDALARWLDEHEVAAVVDATHPFAERISAIGRAACRGRRRAAAAPRAPRLDASARATAGRGSPTSTRPRPAIAASSAVASC